MSSSPIVSRSRLIAGVAALLIATSTASVLWALARAPDQADRIRDIRARQEAANALPKPSESKSSFPEGAVCESGLAPAELLFRGRAADAAAASGVSITGFDASAVAADSVGLATLRVSMEVDGPYASGLNFTKILADATPTIFVDELDVVSGPGGSARWRIAGRLFCAVRLAP